MVIITLCLDQPSDIRHMTKLVFTFWVLGTYMDIITYSLLIDMQYAYAIKKPMEIFRHSSAGGPAGAHCVCCML